MQLTEFFKPTLDVLLMNNFIQMVLAALLSFGLTYFFGIRALYTEAKLKFKAEKYSALIKALSNFCDNDSGEHNLLALNEALFFSSDAVVREIKKFNELYTTRRGSAIDSGQKNITINSEDLVPLITAIRTELNLKSKSIKEGELRFFQNPKK